MITLLIALAALQKDAGAPMLAAGVSTEFQSLVMQVEKKLEASDFAGARQLSPRFPRLHAKLAYDDSKVPSALKDLYRSAVARAIKSWQRYESGVYIEVVKDKGDMKVDFEPVLATPPGKALPAPSTIFFGDGVQGPVVESVIGLQRGQPLVDARPEEIQNEVAYAIGSYYGLAPEPFNGWVMGRDDVAGQRAYDFSAREALVAKQNMEAVASLTQAITARKVVQAVRPKAFIDPTAFVNQRLTQGDAAKFTLQITNSGTGPLTYTPMADCSCITASHGQTIIPGSTALISVSVDTSLLDGDFHKRLIFMSNDVDHPFIEIPINLHVDPLYRMVGPVSNGFALDETHKSFDIYMWVAKGSKLEPMKAQFSLPGSTVTYEPWSGMLADPNRGEIEPVARQGYCFHVTLGGDMPLGRMYAMLQVATGNDKFPVLQYTLTVQKGIVAVPEQLYMGSLDPIPRDFELQVTRPGRPFEIKDVETTSVHLSVVKKDESADHNIVLRYDGKGDSGVLQGFVKIHTDDPQQPLVQVPFAATIP